MKTNPTIAVLACEESADYLGGNLIKELKRIYPQANFIGVGGVSMKKHGVDPLVEMEELTAHGIIEVAHRIPKLFRIMKSIQEEMIKAQPDVFIGIDAPDFNLNLEKRLLASGINTVHYISPTIWSWRPKRVFKVAKAVRLLLCTYPFEVELYEKLNAKHGLNINAHYIGHPLADELPIEPVPKMTARKKLGLDATSQHIKYIGILPGSRSTEINFLSQIFIDSAANCLKQNGNLRFIFAAIHERAAAYLEELLAKSGLPASSYEIFIRRSHDIMAAADVILLASGTATLEAMLMKRPMVVAYKVPLTTYWITKMLLKTKFISQPNLMFGKEMVKELVQYDAKPELITAEVMKQLSIDFSSQEKEYIQMHENLKKNASRTAAEQIAKLIN